jgi:hypothetical protein
MALIKCRECGREISSQSPACPGCGAPVKPKRNPALGCLGVLGILFLIAVLLPKESERPSAANTAGSSATATPSPTPVPTPSEGTSERVKYEVEKALGKSYRNVKRIWDMQISPQTIRVRFSIDKNLTAGLIKVSARTDVRLILQAVQRARYPYAEVTAIGSFPLKDQYGNSEETEVLRVTYRRATVDRINWDGFDSDNIYRIADSVWVHPSFQ